MDKEKLGRILIIPLVLITAAVLVAVSACTPREAELLQGVLQNVDAVNGKITIVTKDGKTVTLTIATEAPVETDGGPSTIETLEPGASVEVGVSRDGQVAQRIDARLAKVEGTIIEVVGDNVTIETERGRRVTVRVTDRTRIELEDDFPGTLADLRVGLEVEVKFDPESRVAFKIDTEEEEAEIEGVVVQIVGDNVAIETEWGHRRTLVVTSTTRIELEDDFPGTLADLLVGMVVEAKFDPSTRQAFKIEVEEEELSAMGGWGIIEIRVTDPPPADVKSAIVYLTNIEVHRVADNASDNTSGWIPVIGAPPSFDLMVVAEVEAILGSANVTAGRFTQIRMDVDRVEVVTTDNISYTAEVPSGKLKIVRPFNVGGGTTTVLTLDFDGEKSLIITGSGKFLFKPVVKLEIEGKGEGGTSGTGRGPISDNETEERGQGRRP